MAPKSLISHNCSNLASYKAVKVLNVAAREVAATTPMFLMPSAYISLSRPAPFDFSMESMRFFADFSPIRSRFTS